LKAGIIGFPLSGKTTLFKILTKAHVDTPRLSGGKIEAHVGIAKVPDPRLDELALLFNPKKTTHATVEYIDVAGLVKGESKDAAQLGNLKNVDALVHVVRAFEDDSLPHAEGSVNPKRDIANFELELLLSDLGIIEKRMERLEKDIKKQRSSAFEAELELLKRCKVCVESEKPIRRLELNEDEKKILRGFMFLSEKPILHVLNLSDSDAAKIDQIVSRYQLEDISAQANVAIILDDYGLKESGLDRLIRVTYQLLGLISFFTVGDDECRAWTITRGTTALKAAGVIHSDIERCFIRAEVIHCDKLLELRGLAAARDKGLLRMEGKGYIVQEGDVINFRHSG